MEVLILILAMAIIVGFIIFKSSSEEALEVLDKAKNSKPPAVEKATKKPTVKPATKTTAKPTAIKPAAKPTKTTTAKPAVTKTVKKKS